MKKQKETPEEFAARLSGLLREECEDKRPEGEELAYVLFVAEPENVEGRITYASNVPRGPVIKFLEEWMERNKPARGRGK